MNVGDYVRTKDGVIGKLMGNNAYDENKLAIHTKTKNDIKITPIIERDEIIKSSPNIIDLIEVGDYVNGERVINIIKKYEYLEVSDEEVIIDKKDIKSIVTKEQFESMEYKIKE